MPEVLVVNSGSSSIKYQLIETDGPTRLAKGVVERVRIDTAVIENIRDQIPLAPLHNPANLAGIEVARLLWPDVPQVAVFDTAFHATLEPHAYRYAVPNDWYARHRVR